LSVSPNLKVVLARADEIYLFVFTENVHEISVGPRDVFYPKFIQAGFLSKMQFKGFAKMVQGVRESLLVKIRNFWSKIIIVSKNWKPSI